MRKAWLIMAALMVASGNIYAQGGSAQQDSLALVALYNATDGDNWDRNDNWLKSRLSSTWRGVTVEGNRVVSLLLSRNQLKGTIPPELGNLTNLFELHLESNQLTGAIPVALGNLSNLGFLDLSENELTEAIPVALGNLSNLGFLSLGSNQLTGTIPAELGNLSNLGFLSLENNQLTGTIPAELGDLSNLISLFLDGNQLTGTIPAELGNLSNLGSLLLENNQLTGTIPVELGNLTNLFELHLESNQLTGTIPAELGNLTNLIDLGLNSNQLEGSIPAEMAEMGNLSNLRVLSLQDNQFDDLPALTALTALEELRVQNNQLTFEDIEPNVDVADNLFEYAPQADVGEARSDTVAATDSFTLQVSVGGQNNVYQWFKDNNLIDDANEDTYTDPCASPGDAGVYVLKITNPKATDLTLRSEPDSITVAEESSFSDSFPRSVLPETYRMVSVPYVLGNPDLGSVLINDYDDYDTNVWRLFRWRNDVYDDYDEFPNIDTSFTLGNAFWLITRAGGGFGVENATASHVCEPVELTLLPGWNQIGNPFPFPVAWADFRGSEQEGVGEPVAFDGAEYDFGQKTLRDWEGYFVENLTLADITLIVQPIAATAASKRAAAPLVGSDYAVQVAATLERRGLRDTQNFAGFAEGAAEGRDRLDYAEPPGIGDYLRLSLVEDGERLAGSYKPLGGEGQQWAIEVEAIIKREVLPRRREVEVELIEHGERPAGWGLYVLDLDAGRVLPLDGQRFAVTLDNDVRHLSLLLGTEAYAEAHSEGIALAPVAFVLEQNYPNPFNPETVIPYRLSERVQVELVIYDVLGRRVRTLIDRVEEAGTYAVRWQGRDDGGVPLASGVYVYRLQAGRFTNTHTMLLVR